MHSNWPGSKADVGRVFCKVQSKCRLRVAAGGDQKAAPRKSEQLASNSLQNLTGIGEREPESRFSGSLFFSGELAQDRCIPALS